MRGSEKEKYVPKLANVIKFGMPGFFCLQHDKMTSLVDEFAPNLLVMRSFSKSLSHILTLFYSVSNKLPVREEALNLNRGCDNVLSVQGYGAVIDRRRAMVKCN